jgi:FtsP/CotA-like multicopper oxidase with cupredoxin domain
MSTRQRIGFVALAVAVATAAIVLLTFGDSNERGEAPGRSAAQDRPATRDGSRTPAASGDRATVGQASGDRGAGGEPAAPERQGESAGPRSVRIALEAGEPEGGVEDITVTSGEVVRLIVTSDAPDEIHLHGYDIEHEAAPGQPARFRFEADIEGSFEIESHLAQDAGREPLIATLVVEPS